LVQVLSAESSILWYMLIRFKRLAAIGCILILQLICVQQARSQKPIDVRSSIHEHKFRYNEIEYLEDPEGRLSIEQVLTMSGQFRASKNMYPEIRNKSAYWYRLKLNVIDTAEEKFPFVLEFYDQSIDSISAYLPDGKGNWIVQHTGAGYSFNNRLLDHKNFEIKLPSTQGEQVLYFRVASSHNATVIILLRSIERFVGYALAEYLNFGIFYGMIIIFVFYNLLMYIAMRQRQYVYYILYILSVGMYEMASDGIAYQYVWPEWPVWNRYAYGIALYMMSIFALLFTRDLLQLKTRAPRINLLIQATIAARSLFFIFCLLYDKSLFSYKIIEFIPLAVAFFSAAYVYRQGYKAARFLVLGYGFLIAGFLIKVMSIFRVEHLFQGPVSHYSLTICFIIEMLLLSLAIGDKVRILKKKKEKAQLRIIAQMEQNMQLKDSLNQELEVQVQKRTKELTEKSEEIVYKAQVIEQQNEELIAMNALLKQQADEISRINQLLKNDNQELQKDITTVTRARIHSTEVNFEEFSNIYPDDEACFKFLSDIKWENGFACRKCGNDRYFSGRLPYSRKCNKCSYEESATAHTIFQNTRIPINKAFYLLFLVYSSKGEISSYKLSELLSIRQSTCWAYGSKIKRVMDERKKELSNAGEKGWSKLVLESV
jgi:two-component system, sensor histidine kinase LadS